MIAGVTHLRILGTEEATAWSLQAGTLQRAVQEDLDQGLLPFYLCATVGTTSTATVDDLRGLATVAQQHNIWWVGHPPTSAVCMAQRKIFMQIIHGCFVCVTQQHSARHLLSFLPLADNFVVTTVRSALRTFNCPDGHDIHVSGSIGNILSCDCCDNACT